MEKREKSTSTKLFIGALAGVAAFFVLKILKDQGKLDKVTDDVTGAVLRAKRGFKNALDSGKNQAEYLRDKAEYELKKAKRHVGADHEAK